jgi:hypothetical protein
MEQEQFVNESGGGLKAQSRPINSAKIGIAQRGEQPPANAGHRASDMPLLRVPLTAVLAVFCASMAAQTVAPGSTAPQPLSANLRPALSQVAQTLNSIAVRRWKAPQPVRDETDEDVTSIQRDLNGTLAGLLQQADAAPGSVPAAFAVYRNIDALYDTLLRVVETAELAAPENEEAQLESALKSLEGARSSLGDTVLSGAQSQQTELLHLRATIQAAASAPKAPVKTVVVNDGPATPAPATHHKRTTPPSEKKPASSTSSSSSSSGSSPQTAKPNPGTASPQ